MGIQQSLHEDLGSFCQVGNGGLGDVRTPGNMITKKLLAIKALLRLMSFQFFPVWYCLVGFGCVSLEGI